MSLASEFLKKNKGLSCYEIEDRLEEMYENEEVLASDDWIGDVSVWRFPDISSVVMEGSDVSALELTDAMIAELCEMTTRDEAGVHFTENREYYTDLERLGLIQINRPIHEQTGMDYDISYWTISFTPEALEVIDAHPEFH